jgi:hypothetical protein
LTGFAGSGGLPLPAFFKVVSNSNKIALLICVYFRAYLHERRSSFSSPLHAYLTFQSFICTPVTVAYQSVSFSKETS